ncbi:MAG: hypothetical protein LBT96_02170 [Campylobacteraceae bacterium]|jgi:hypothetical protein|nr:hypothetical protein [Campylobacteraceae bacterium]
MKKLLLLTFLSVGFCFAQSSLERAKEACESGYLEGCIDVGVRYKKGMGVRKDPFKAMEYFAKTCEGGNASGCNLDDLIYFSKDGVDADYFFNRFRHYNGFYNRHGYGFGYDKNDRFDFGDK